MSQKSFVRQIPPKNNSEFIFVVHLLLGTRISVSVDCIPMETPLEEMISSLSVNCQLEITLGSELGLMFNSFLPYLAWTCTGSVHVDIVFVMSYARICNILNTYPSG